MKGLLFTYLLTYGGAVISLFSPFAGLLIYICFAIVKPDSMWYWSVPPGNYSRIVAAGMLVGWALHGFGHWQFGRARGIAVCFAGFVAWALLSALNAPQPDRGLAFVESFAKILLPFLVGMTTIDSIDKLKKVAWVMALSQGYVALEMNLSYLGGYNRIRDEGFARM
ncbi:MAG: DUF5935 domain-containing protein, partial [Terriglobia bacterium]